MNIRDSFTPIGTGGEPYALKGARTVRKGVDYTGFLPYNYVPAVAVIRMGLVLFILIGFKGYLDG
jgi:hypothetical protein